MLFRFERLNRLCQLFKLHFLLKRHAASRIVAVALLRISGVVANLGRGTFLGLQGAPFSILRIVAGKVLHHAVTLEYEQMVYRLVHKVTVVTDDDYAARKVLKVFLEYL